MLQLKCTSKMQNLLKLKPADLQPIVPTRTPLGDWFVNVLMIDHRKTILFVNEKTASSFVIYGFKQAHIPIFYTFFLNGLLRFLMLQEVPTHKIDAILKSYREVAFTKTDSKQLLGTMNDLAFHYEHAIWSGHGYKNCDLTKIIQSMNRIPFKSVDYAYPNELLREIVMQL